MLGVKRRAQDRQTQGIEWAKAAVGELIARVLRHIIVAGHPTMCEKLPSPFLCRSIILRHGGCSYARVRAGRSIAEALLVVAVGEFAAVYGVTLTTLQQSVSLHAGNVRSIRFGTQRYARL
ncbi:hypothetical protein An04g08570 [Aspergillus niger]|uniref:Uncharacterized protein n=2 Tax=Aspergillus niger TaxID=5061 RepID=A2QJX2_ASPNC|nr:hypothetical protein An04g08570 [Aspergillus niger]CAK38944.1 hypothetical protein An04g08570 [Aspergillus niger]